MDTRTTAVIKAAKAHGVKAFTDDFLQKLQTLESETERLFRKGENNDQLGTADTVYSKGEIYKVSQLVRGLMMIAQGFPSNYRYQRILLSRLDMLNDWMMRITAAIRPNARAGAFAIGFQKMLKELRSIRDTTLKLQAEVMRGGR